jgi:hypothetical protein
LWVAERESLVGQLVGNPKRRSNMSESKVFERKDDSLESVGGSSVVESTINQN